MGLNSLQKKKQTSAGSMAGVGGDRRGQEGSQAPCQGPAWPTAPSFTRAQQTQHHSNAGAGGIWPEGCSCQACLGTRGVGGGLKPFLSCNNPGWTSLSRAGLAFHAGHLCPDGFSDYGGHFTSSYGSFL